MNNFIICVGGYLPEFTERAKAIGLRMGKVHVDTGGTECKVPLIAPHIEKMETCGSICKNRTTTRC
jgi:hypothetical protein